MIAIYICISPEITDSWIDYFVEETSKDFHLLEQPLKHNFNVAFWRTSSNCKVKRRDKSNVKFKITESQCVYEKSWILGSFIKSIHLLTVKETWTVLSLFSIMIIQELQDRCRRYFSLCPLNACSLFIPRAMSITVPLIHSVTLVTHLSSHRFISFMFFLTILRYSHPNTQNPEIHPTERLPWPPVIGCISIS